MLENVPGNLSYVFRQQGNLLQFEDLLHNLYFIFPQNSIYFLLLSPCVHIICFS